MYKVSILQIPLEPPSTLHVQGYMMTVVDYTGPRFYVICNFQDEHCSVCWIVLVYKCVAAGV